MVFLWPGPSYTSPGLVELIKTVRFGSNEPAYDAIDSSMIWAIIMRHLKPLYEEVKALIDYFR